MAHPETAVVTDGILTGTPHPRVFGSFPRVLGRYVRERNVLRLEDAVRKMTSLSAERLRLARKGRIEEGYDADIVVFDPGTVRDTGTYEKPDQQPEGIRWVIVNGSIAVADGRLTGSASGRTIR
jgi:N-acyl-D-amino-acid deacylase